MAVTPVPADDGISDFPPGKIALNLNLGDISGIGEFNWENLNYCLANHFDYLLWLKGWEFEIISGDSTRELPVNMNRLSNSEFRYLMNVDIKASFRSGKIHTINGNGQGKENYHGYLDLTMTVRLYDLTDGEKLIREKKSGAKARGEWVKKTEAGYFPEEMTYPESPDFVIRRVIAEALEFLPTYGRRIENGRDDLPVCLVVDSALFDSRGGIDSTVYAACEYASRSLRRQFGFGLNICREEKSSAEPIPINQLGTIFDSFAGCRPRHGDTITVAIIRPLDPERFYLADQVTRIGLSDLGRRTMMMADLIPPDSAEWEWKGLLNGQLLLHEIGHLLGAIHVSDISSIMTPRTTWVASDHFDSLNQDIITHLNQSSIGLNGVSDYLKLVVSSLDNTGYRLADYPATFFSYVNLNRHRLGETDFGNSAIGKSIGYALDGYRQYLMKNNWGARDLFYMSLVCDSTQGSIHYYLSRVTDGKLSEYHLKQACRIGYYKAVGDYYSKSR